jgi:DNA (cytosine-5)-methyltransferase 1
VNELALFAGAGGGILGGLLHGWRTVAAVEIEDYPRRVLLQRQADGVLPRFPIWDDVCTFDGRPWQGRVDVITGGFPCQDISAAGKGEGLEGKRSGLWSEMARIISEVRPQYALVENSPMLTGRGLDVVLMDLAEIGYDAVWTVLGADDVGAPHRRKRIWILAYSNSIKRGSSCLGQDTRADRRDNAWRCGQVAYTNSGRGDKDLSLCELRADWPEQSSTDQGPPRQAEGRKGSAWWHEDPADIPNTTSAGLLRAQEPQDNGADCQGGRRCHPDDTDQDGAGGTGTAEPRLGGMADGLADRLDFAGASAGMVVPRLGHGIPDRVNRLKAIGNGQVALAAAVAWEELLLLVKDEA